MSLSRDVGAVLRAAVSTLHGPGPDDVLARTPPDRLRGLARAAAMHGIVGYVSRAVEASSARDRVPTRTRAELRHATEDLVARHEAVVSNLQQLRIVFDTLQVPWVVVKGPVLAEPVHGAGELRTYGDLDVIVPPEHFGAALDGFTDGGADVLAGDWRRRRDERAGEVPVRLPSGLLVDVHWHLINTGSVRDHFRIPIDELLRRRTSVIVGGVEVPTLDPADTLVHVALHTTLSGSNRLVWIKDMERLVARYGQDVLDEATARAAAWGASLAMADAMGRVARVLGLPHDVRWTSPSGRGTRAWLAVSATTERLSPVERQDGGASLLRIVSRAVREDGPSSARALAGKVLRHAAEMIRPAPGGHTVHSDEASSSGYRARYLADVARASVDPTRRKDPRRHL